MKAPVLILSAILAIVSTASGQQQDGSATNSSPPLLPQGGAGVAPVAGAMPSPPLLPQGGARSAPLADPYGVCAHLPRHDADFRDEECRGIAALGASTVRFGVSWRGMQKSPDAPLDFSRLDAIVAEAEAHGLTILPILYWPPKWARPIYEHLDEYAAFVEAVVSRYGERFPAIELWNEENLKGFWGGEPDPAKYALVLKAGYEAAKFAGSHLAATPSRGCGFPAVYFGGTAGVPLGYIRSAYEAGAAPYFDAMAVHPYNHPYAPEGDLDRKLEDLRALMAEFGDAEKPVVITEHGWPTHKATVPCANVLLAGLKVARPEQKAWRVVFAATSGAASAPPAASLQLQVGAQSAPLADLAAAIEEVLPPGSSCEACFGARLRERLAAGDVDAVIYPFDETFPSETFGDVLDFVRNGGVLVDGGGVPLWMPCRLDENGIIVKEAEGKTGDPLNRRELLRIAFDAPWLNPALPDEGRAFPTAAALAAGYKGDPAGERVFRFFTPRLLQPGDEFIPLLTMPLEKRKDSPASLQLQVGAQSAPLAESAVAACVMRFGSDFKGAAVLSGDRRRGQPAATDEAGQARYLVRSMAIAFACGVERYFWYEFRAPEDDPHYSEDHFGLTHADMAPKPAFAAYRDFVAKRPPGSVQRRVPLRDSATGVWRSEWTRPDGTVAGVFWKPGEIEDPVFFEGEAPVPEK